MAQRSVNWYICCRANFRWIAGSQQQQQQTTSNLSALFLFAHFICWPNDRPTIQLSNKPKRNCPRLRLDTRNANYKKAHTPNEICIYFKPNDNRQAIIKHTLELRKCVLQHELCRLSILSITLSHEIVLCTGSWFFFRIHCFKLTLEKALLRIISFWNYLSF